VGGSGFPEAGRRGSLRVEIPHDEGEWDGYVDVIWAFFEGKSNAGVDGKRTGRHDESAS
jgi:hypothetical protein